MRQSTLIHLMKMYLKVSCIYYLFNQTVNRLKTYFIPIPSLEAYSQIVLKMQQFNFIQKINKYRYMSYQTTAMTYARPTDIHLFLILATCTRLRIHFSLPHKYYLHFITRFRYPLSLLFLYIIAYIYIILIYNL